MTEWNADETTIEPFGDGGDAVQGNSEVVDAPRKQRVRKGDIEK